MRLVNQLMSYIPRRLPVGMAEFDVFSNRVIDVTGEFADRDSMRFALASQVLHLGPQQAYVSDQFFIRSLTKAAANQIASAVFQDIKTKQQEAAKKAQEAKAAEEAAAVTSASQAADSLVTE